MHHLNFFASTALLLFLLLACPNMVTAARNDAVPATDAPCIVPAIAYTNGSAEMTLCVQSHKVWREKRNNVRTAQVHVMLENTGASMVCDLRVEVEGMEHALRWWPDWLDTTRYPYFHMSPGQTVSVGAVICQEQGFPNVSIVEMRSCDGEDPPASYFDSPQKKDHLLVSFDKAHKPRSKPTPKQTAAASKPKKPTFAATPSADADVAGAEEEEEDDDDDDDDEDAEGTEEEDGVPASTLKKPYCTTKEGADGLKARWCLERQPYVWVEPKHHRRIVRTRAEITNLQPNVSLCGIKVELEANKSAINTWPDWWPESDEDDPLDPGNSFVLGANVYYKKGAPKIHLLGFRACIDLGAVPDEPEPAAPAADAPVAATNPTAPADGGQRWNASAGGGSTSNTWQQPPQQQQNDWSANNRGQQSGGDGGSNNDNHGNWGQPPAQQGDTNNWGQQRQAQQNNWGGDNNNNNWQH